MVSLGTMNFGTTLGSAEAFDVLDLFTEAGGRAVDTANCYASWIGTGDESELVLGGWRRRRGTCDRILPAAKVGDGPSGSGAATEFEGLSPQVIRPAVEDSLRRLNTDYVDACFAHVMDPTVPIEETVGAFGELVEAGKVLEIGLSKQSLESLQRAGQSVTWLQQSHSYLDPMPDVLFGPQQFLTEPMAEYVCQTPYLKGQGYPPLLSGAYTRPERKFPPHYQHPANAARLIARRKVSGALGVSVNQVVLAWMLASTPLVRPVIGVSSTAQLADCLASAEVVLGDEQLRCLETA